MQEIVIINKNDIIGNYLHGFEQESISFKKDKKDVKLIPETWNEMIELLKYYINDWNEYSKPINLIIPNEYNKLQNDGLDINNTIFTQLDKKYNKYYITQDFINYIYITNDINIFYLLILSRIKEKYYATNK